MPSFLKLLSSFTIIFSVLACKQVLNEKTEDRGNLYMETHRPQFHFTPAAHWMNDPNGLVYFDGEYHLFYQYYPEGIVWGPMHWGHAVSNDMMHWKHLPVALYPDSLGYIFSGSAVIDKGNTAGFGKDAMVAIFTHHDMNGEKAGSTTFQNQSIAYSTDRGRTFIKYEGNPVIKNPGIKDFRDPKVIWHKESNLWIMVFAAYDRVVFYTSPNLKEWTKTSEFGIAGDTRLWECPDLFPIKIEGMDAEKWVLLTSIQKEGPNGGTATSYFVGDFDGKTFKGDTTNQKWLDYGKDNYAMVTWSNVEDDRILALGWMSNWQYAQQVPTQKWRSAMTLPRTLRLSQIGEEYYLKSLPVKETNTLTQKTSSIKPHTIRDSLLIVNDSTCNLYLVDLSFKKPSKGSLIVKFANDVDDYISVGYNAENENYFIDRTHSGIMDFSEEFAGNHSSQIRYVHETIHMVIYLDVASVELFADDGKTVMTDIMFPTKPYSTISIEVDGDEVELIEGTLSELSGVWR